MVIRMRHTRAHTGNRRSHHALKGSALGPCPKCQAPHLRHHLCLACGYYRGREVVNVLAKTQKKAAKKAKATKGGR